MGLVADPTTAAPIMRNMASTMINGRPGDDSIASVGAAHKKLGRPRRALRSETEQTGAQLRRLQPTPSVQAAPKMAHMSVLIDVHLSPRLC